MQEHSRGLKHGKVTAGSEQSLAGDRRVLGRGPRGAGRLGGAVGREVDEGHLWGELRCLPSGTEEGGILGGNK